jgi:HD domain
MLTDRAHLLSRADLEQARRQRHAFGLTCGSLVLQPGHPVAAAALCGPIEDAPERPHEVDVSRVLARFVHAADAYVAMTRDRPYREAMTQDDAFAELERHSGTQFDPDVVAALVALERARAPASSEPAEPIRPEPPALEDGRPLAA